MRIETVGNATLYLADAADVLPTIPKCDAMVTDPPYGIDVDTTMAKQGGTQHGASLAPRSHYEATGWDSEPIQQWLLDAAIEKAKHAIVFGGNYYRLPPSSCWLVWDKENGNNGYADCELAWTNLHKAVRRLKYQWHGMLRANDEPRGEHPTQKPIQLMEWCIKQLPEGCQTILDPFMGSGTTGVAAAALGLKFIGIEREEKYFDRAVRRIANHQQRLFA